MKRTLISVLLLFSLLALAGCAPPAERADKTILVSKDALNAVQEVKAMASKRVSNRELSLLFQDTRDLADKYREMYPEVPGDEWDYPIMQMYYRNSKYVESVEFGEYFLDKYNSSTYRTSVLMMTGYSNFKLRYYDKAADCYLEVMEGEQKYANLPLAMYNAAVNLDLSGDRGRARRILKKMLNKYPDSRWSANAHLVYAIFEHEAGERSSAAQHAFEYLSSEPFLGNLSSDRVLVLKDIIEWSVETAETPSQKLRSASMDAYFNARAYDRQARVSGTEKGPAALTVLENTLKAHPDLDASPVAAYMLCLLRPAIKENLDFAFEWRERADRSLRKKFDYVIIRNMYTMQNFENLFGMYWANKLDASYKNGRYFVAQAGMELHEYDQVKKVCEIGLEAEPENASLQNMRDLASLVGKPAPEVSGKDMLTGKEVSLAAIKGKAVLLWFWASWDRQNPRYIPAVKQLVSELGGSFAVLGFCLDNENSAENAREVLQQMEVSWPVIFTGEGYSSPLRQEYYFRGTSMYLIDSKGIVRHVSVTPDELKMLLENM
ncbi:MAG: redoxin domain-containing protein [Planctomycetota bacterium]|nr:redoxin domain-containing protein [Planctomycetota bacterium]